MNNIAHIAVDFQNDFVAENGALSVTAEELWWIIRQIIDECKKNAIKNLATKDWHPRNHLSFASSKWEEPRYEDGSRPDHCLAWKRWSELHRSINHSVDKVIHKWMNKNKEEYSGFATGALNAALKEYGVTSLLITWVATDYCVSATALDARKLWYEVTVVSDAVKAVDEEQWEAKIDEMKAAWIVFKHSSEVLENLKKIAV